MTSLAVQDPIEAQQRTGVSLDEYKRKSREDGRSAIFWGSGLILLHIILLVFGVISFSDLFRSLLFIIGVVSLAAGIWEYYQAKKLTVDDLTKHNEAQAFTKSIEKTPIIYTTVVLAFLIVVAVLQMIAGEEASIQAAGLVKSAVWEGETWRLLTCATLHVNFVHIWMNGQALVGLGRMIESLTNRAYLAIVFLPSALCGSIFSLLLMPNSTSVGASGGIMGLVGFLAVLGYRRKEFLPSGFFKSILINICFIGAIGLVGFAIIDNAAHLGGLVAGVVCGVVFINKAGGVRVTNISRLVWGLGLVSLLAIAAISVFSIMKIAK
ncbi:MAG TPA: rhomboid family intramembrane serine protease [Anaerolineales bacterium]|nr:rhomboid family intramembrane serine protease [Anaerolineales bacterium]